MFCLRHSDNTTADWKWKPIREIVVTTSSFLVCGDMLAASVVFVSLLLNEYCFVTFLCFGFYYQHANEFNIRVPRKRE